MPNGAVITSHDYEIVDGAGNRKKVVEHIGTTTYDYDVLNRLTEASYPATGYGGAQTVNWTYNDAGDRLTQAIVSGATTNYGYDADGQMTSAGSTSYGYDGMGNQSSRTSNAFEYQSAANQMTKSTISSQVTNRSLTAGGLET